MPKSRSLFQGAPHCPRFVSRPLSTSQVWFFFPERWLQNWAKTIRHVDGPKRNEFVSRTSHLPSCLRRFILRPTKKIKEEKNEISPLSLGGVRRANAFGSRAESARPTVFSEFSPADSSRRLVKTRKAVKSSRNGKGRKFRVTDSFLFFSRS